MNSILEEDLFEIINNDNINWDEFRNKTFLITGSTGLIGSLLVRALLLANKEKNLNISFYLPVRSIDKAKDLFGNEYINYMETDMENYKPIDTKIDYIIHAASPTKSKFLKNNPVEVIQTSVIGTMNMLKQAKISNVDSVVYLSSMEMYGTLNDDNVTEEKQGYIDLSSTRSSYPESKRICELYCTSAFSEYGIPVKMARLAQTFGAGISESENRSYKYFVDQVLNDENIVLKSTGQTKVNFSYTTDSILGILTILQKGKNGEAYNIVSDSLGMNILDSAKWLTENYSDSSEVIVDVDPNSNFAPDNSMVLNNDKLKTLGWKPKYNLKDGYDRLISYLKNERNKTR